MDQTSATSYDIHASARVDASPDAVYAVASDITRMGEWSPECVGGEWKQGEPGALGSRFLGHNRAGERTWSAECEVVGAEPGRRFAWAVLSSSPDNENSVWSFEVEPDGDGSLLTQRYRMHTVPGGLRQVMAELPPEKAETFLEERRTQLQDAMRQTVEGVKKAVENR